MSEEEYEYEESDGEEYSGDYGEEEYTGIRAILHDEKMEPHVHLAILLTVTFIVAVIVYVAGF